MNGLKLREALEAVKPFEKLFSDADRMGKLSQTNIDAQIATVDLRRLAYAASDLREALSASKQEPQRCKTCDGTGDIHRIDGDYLGECPHCKPEPVGINGLTYAEESATASVLGIVNSKPEPQDNRTHVDSGALTMALNVLRRAGKNEVADALEETAVRGKPEPQAQAEPIKGYLHLKPPFEDENGEDISGEYITLQSHREAMAKLQAERDLCEQQADYWQGEAANFSVAIAKKDAALKACVEALRNSNYWLSDAYTRDSAACKKNDVAITQAEEAMR